MYRKSSQIYVMYSLLKYPAGHRLHSVVVTTSSPISGRRLAHLAAHLLSHGVADLPGHRVAPLHGHLDRHAVRDRNAVVDWPIHANLLRHLANDGGALCHRLGVADDLRHLAGHGGAGLPRHVDAAGHADAVWHGHLA